MKSPFKCGSVYNLCLKLLFLIIKSLLLVSNNLFHMTSSFSDRVQLQSADEAMQL